MKSLCTIVGAVTMLGWIADLAFGASLALRGLPLPSHFGSPFMHFTYGLFGGATP